MVKGKDQRDYYYFMALGHYKLEVGDVWRWEVCGGGLCVEVEGVWSGRYVEMCVGVRQSVTLTLLIIITNDIMLM